MRKVLLHLTAAATTLALASCVGQRVAGQSAPETLTNAVSSPLYDVNVLRTKIPEVLLDAMDSPYALPSPMSCPEIAAQVRPLDEALGPDLDMELSGEDPGLIERGHGAALNALGDAASGVIPLRSWVRKLSGAEQHDRYVRAVIAAGSVRRAYLKGLGQRLSCRPPAAPAPIALNRVAPGIYPPAEQKLQPKYPIR
jgi:hypothetical protein